METSMGSLLIRGGRVLSPEDRLDDELDVLVRDGTIREIAPSVSVPAEETLEARGQVVAPGFIDLHAHLREPGGEVSETLETGLAAAAAGGFTAVCAMPNTQPPIDCAERVRAAIDKARRIALARLFPIAAVSVGSQGEKLTDLRALVAAGAVGFSDDGRPVKTAELLREAMRQARKLNVPLIDHCEDTSLSAGGVVGAGPVAERLGVGGIPNRAEDVSVERDLRVAEETGAHLHVAHLSTGASMAMVRAAKRRGLRVTCEVTPHHFSLTDAAVLEYGTHAKMNPPLRSPSDLETVLTGIADGTVDALATDHAPHAPQLKQLPILEAPFGVIGFETAFALALARLVHTRRVSLSHLIVLMSSNPARIIRQPLGRVSIGAPADLTLFDPDLEWTYRAAEGRSKSRNSPFEGWAFKGAVTATIVAGGIVYRRR